MIRCKLCGEMYNESTTDLFHTKCPFCNDDINKAKKIIDKNQKLMDVIIKKMKL